MKVRIYTDGGARGNPGPAGAGAVIKEIKQDGKDGKVLAEIAEYMGVATNNQAEYTAILRGIEKAKELGATEIDFVMDSELAVRQLNGIYKVKNTELAKIFLKIHNLRVGFKNVTFRHVRREYNKEADALVNLAIDRGRKDNSQ